MKHIILFDGECVLCNWAAKFILKRDKNKLFSIISLQSEEAKILIEGKDIFIDENDETIVLIEGDEWYTHSKAALRISRNLSGLWPILYIFIIVPSPVSDVIYRFIGRNRKKWFGEVNTCDIEIK